MTIEKISEKKIFITNMMFTHAALEPYPKHQQNMKVTWIIHQKIKIQSCHLKPVLYDFPSSVNTYFEQRYFDELWDLNNSGPL